MVSIILFSIFLNLVTCFCLSIFLLVIKNKYKTFTVFNINLIFWSLFYILAITADTPEKALFYYRIHLAFTVFIPYFAFNFVLEFSNHYLDRRIRNVVLFIAILLSASMFTGFGITSIRPFLDFKFVPKTGIGFDLWVLYYSCILLYIHTILYKIIKNDSRNRLVFISYLIGFLGGSTNIFFYLGIPIYQWGNYLVSVYGCLITYAIIKHRIFDVSVIVNEGLARLLAIIILAILYFVLGNAYHTLDPKATLISDNLFNLSFILLALELYRFLVKKFHNAYRWEILLKKINQKLIDVMDVNGLWLELRNIFEKEIKAEIKMLVIFGNNHNSQIFGDYIKAIPEYFLQEIKKLKLPVTKNDAPTELQNIFDSENSVLIPFISHLEVIGFMMVSKSSSKLNYNDLMLFDNLSFQIGVLADRINAYQEISARKIDHEIALQKEKSLQDKALALKSLAGSIAHEMRNPLNALNLSLNEITDAASKNELEKINQYSAIGKNSIGRANQVINMILAELRDQNLEVKNLENLSAKKLIEKAIVEYGYNSREEKQRIILDLKEDFIIKVSETLFIYILFNLLKNALYYVGSVITIKTEIRENFNCVIVTDNGPGISKQDLANLFKDFSTSGKKDGTGLGLSFCRRTMTAFGGNIGVESEFGKYTEFSLLFPKIEDATISNISEPRNENSISTKFLGKKKILLADDEELNRKLTAKFLERYHAITDQAAHGEEALEKLKKNNYDLILMDIEMPIMNGLDSVTKIRQHQKNQNLNLIPIIAITGDANPARKEKILETGFNDFFLKGSDCELLLELIVKHLGEDKL